MVTPRLQGADIHRVRPRLCGDVGRPALVPQHPMWTHVPALVTCTMTSLHLSTAQLGGSSDPVTRNYESGVNCAKEHGEIYSQRRFENSM